MNNFMEKLKTTKILAAIGIVCLILGTILPYVRYSFWGYTYSISLWSYWQGKIVMILAIANLLFIFKDLVEKYIPSLAQSEIGEKILSASNPKYSLIPTILIAIFAIYLTTTLSIGSFKYFNIGFYLLWIGTICLIAYAFLHKNDINTNNSNVQNQGGPSNANF